MDIGTLSWMIAAIILVIGIVIVAFSGPEPQATAFLLTVIVGPIVLVVFWLSPLETTPALALIAPFTIAGVLIGLGAAINDFRDKLRSS